MTPWLELLTAIFSGSKSAAQRHKLEPQPSVPLTQKQHLFPPQARIRGHHARPDSTATSLYLHHGNLLSFTILLASFYQVLERPFSIHPSRPENSEKTVLISSRRSGGPFKPVPSSVTSELSLLMLS